MQLWHRCRRGVYPEDGVEAELVVGRDAHIDIRERYRLCHQPAVEVLDLTAIDLEIKRKFLLGSAGASKFVFAASGDTPGRAVISEAPVNVRDDIGVEKSIKPARRE